jgi:hypothetical protein
MICSSCTINADTQRKKKKKKEKKWDATGKDGKRFNFTG